MERAWSDKTTSRDLGLEEVLSELQRWNTNFNSSGPQRARERFAMLRAAPMAVAALAERPLLQTAVSADLQASFLPERPAFVTPTEMPAPSFGILCVLFHVFICKVPSAHVLRLMSCSATGFGTTLSMIAFDELRTLSAGFYDSGAPLLGDYSFVEKLLSRRKEVAAVCPLAVLQAILLQSERLLVSIYTSSSQSSEVHAAQFSEASQLNLEFNILQSWLQKRLGPNASTERITAPDSTSTASNMKESSSDWGWPLRAGWRRVGRYYDLLWQDVYDSREAWAKMDSPDVGELSDNLYHQLLSEVADVLESLEAEWWPCRGTLIALLRHGARSGTLSEGKVDMVERDIDLMVGVSDEEGFELLGRAIERNLLLKGWDRCWTKPSATFHHKYQFAVRRDLLYCMRTKPHMMLDVTSYITGEKEDSLPYVFVHRLCRGEGHEGREGAKAAKGEKPCFVLPDVGPLAPGGGTLPREAIYPLRRCWAFSRSVPCPNQPLQTLMAMSHSGLSTACIALPDTRGRHDKHSQRLAREGLNAKDLQILLDRAHALNSQDFQSMLPYFQNCSGLHETPFTPGEEKIRRSFVSLIDVVQLGNLRRNLRSNSHWSFGALCSAQLRKFWRPGRCLRWRRRQ